MGVVLELTSENASFLRRVKDALGFHLKLDTGFPILSDFVLQFSLLTTGD